MGEYISTRVERHLSGKMKVQSNVNSFTGSRRSLDIPAQVSGVRSSCLQSSFDHAVKYGGLAPSTCPGQWFDVRERQYLELEPEELLRKLFVLCASAMKTQNAPISEVVNMVSQLKRRGDLDNEDYLGWMNENKQTPIEIAVCVGNKVMVGILLEKGDKCLCAEAFLAACRKGKKDILNHLIDSGAHSHLDMHMMTDCVLLCTKHGFTYLLKMLHKAGFLLRNNEKTVTLKFPKTSKFPMLWTLQTGNGHHRVMEYLINQLADIESVDSRGWKPVHLALHGGENCLRVLLEVGVDIEAADNEGHAPLFLASVMGNF